MRIATISPCAWALALAAACGDGAPDPLATSAGPNLGPPAFQAASPDHARLERLARRLALSLSDPSLRRGLLARLDAGSGPERKLHVQALLDVHPGLRGRMEAQAPAEATVAEDASLAGSLELYLPVPAHRDRWRGGDDLLVATAIGDDESPVAYDLNGRRRLLDRDRPPATPVLALVPAEQRFGRPAMNTICPMTTEDECSGGGTPPPAPVGLFMTAASFTGTFEGWLKGSPEFETHVLGQDGGTTNLKSYQCVGEHAGGPYVYDQNGKTWTGSVMLFSQAQLDAYRTQHPGQAVRVLVVEDDDGACVIKTEKDRLTNLFKLLDAVYAAWTGGRDSVWTFGKIFEKAKTLQQIINALASVIKSNDEIVGTAIEDDVAGQTWPGTNWIVKGENNITNGGIRLEMR